MAFSGIFYFVDSGPSVFKYFIRSGLQVLVSLHLMWFLWEVFFFLFKNISCISLPLSHLNHYFFLSLFIYPFIYLIGDCYCFSSFLFYIFFSVYFFSWKSCPPVSVFNVILYFCYFLNFNQLLSYFFVFIFVVLQVNI